jgi:hypothetical protein
MSILYSKIAVPIRWGSYALPLVLNPDVAAALEIPPTEHGDRLFILNDGYWRPILFYDILFRAFMSIFTDWTRDIQ